MTEFLQQFQGFEWWSPGWDAVLILGTGVVVTIFLILIGSFGEKR